MLDSYLVHMKLQHKSSVSFTRWN